LKVLIIELLLNHGNHNCAALLDKTKISKLLQGAKCSYQT